MNSVQELAKNVLTIAVHRKILFAVHHLPKAMPNYWKTIKEFSGADVSVCELQTAVENMEYLSKAAFQLTISCSRKCATTNNTILWPRKNFILVLWGRSEVLAICSSRKVRH